MQLMAKRKIVHGYVISDNLWMKIEPLLPLLKPKKKPRRPRNDDKRILSDIRLEFDIDFSLSAQDLVLISLKPRPAERKLLNR